MNEQDRKAAVVEAVVEALAEQPLDWVNPDRSGFCGQAHREGYNLRLLAETMVEAAWPWYMKAIP